MGENMSYLKKMLFFFVIVIFIMFSGIRLTLVPAVSAQTRGINVVAKSTKGQPQKLHLYDFTAVLIIGIDRYANLDAEHQLLYAVKDAKGIERVLRENYQFDEIITLYNEEATRDKIMRTLYGFQSLSPDAGVFVYFAGHGITMPGMVGGKDLGYLIPCDGSLDSSEMYKNISMQQVKSDICVSINAKHVFFVFDACFAGLMLDTRATLIKPSRDLSYLNAITKEHVRQVLTAGAKGQTVLDGGPGGHSVFTGRFIQALENVEDYITARELGQYLKKRVYGDAAARGHTQRPVDGEIYGTGDFVFVPDLEKRSRDLNAEVDELEAEMARLKRLKKEAGKAKDDSKQRELERQRLIKEAELKQAQIRKKQKEGALKRQKQAELEAKEEAKQRKQQERENEQRLAMLRKQAEKMRQELGADLTGGATLESAVAELKRIKEQHDKINRDFSAELSKQTQSITKFYDDKISRILDISPRDNEFETEDDYKARLDAAYRKAAPVHQEKEQKFLVLHNEIKVARSKQIEPLENQIKILKEKRFTISASQVSFEFLSYILKTQMMQGKLTYKRLTQKFCAPIPKKKAREYKYNPELLVPEVQIRATLNGKKIDKIIFHGPGKSEIYITAPCEDISSDGLFIVYANGTIIEIKTGLEWIAGPNRNTTWYQAKRWVENLNVDGGGWRMPTRVELKALYKKGAGSRNMTPLLKTTGWWVWSGETKDSSSAWVLDFNFGYESRLNRDLYHYGRGFAVRSQR